MPPLTTVYIAFCSNISDDDSLRYFLSKQFSHQFSISEQMTQFYVREHHRRFPSRRRPLETALFQALQMQPESVSVPLQNFQAIPASVTEHKQRFTEWVELKTVFDHDSKAVYCFAHVRVTAGQVNFLTLKFHHRLNNALQTSVNKGLSNPGDTLTTQEPIRTSSGSVRAFFVKASFTSTHSGEGT